ncbi:MAG: CPBP family intramembrane glutamic endopeptidase [Flavisolibacter sp.]
MKKILGNVRNYFIEVDKRILFTSTLFIAGFIFVNYHYGLNKHISHLPDAEQYVSWYFIFLTAFSFPYILLTVRQKDPVFENKAFLLLFFIAPVIFSWKMVADIDIHFTYNRIQNAYWNQILYWPFKLLVVSSVLFIVWRLTRERQPFYGTSVNDFSFKPYLVMLLIMVPLVAAASTQPDFLAMYPKLKSISFLKNQHNNGFYKLLYELSYGSDFFSIELFFRGFLVLAFAKWFGKDAILPMACFYCTIHFGKPLGECISSFFGGVILGIVIYHTRTIFGGLMVHLGIAWMMELGGYLGNLYFH